jgi:hypothetical protein
MSGAAATVTCTAGTGQSVNVPDHVGGVTLAAAGGDGGASGGPAPDYAGGGSDQGVYTKAGPFTLTVDVGTAGVNAVGITGGAGGVPGGGAGADGSSPNAGGGGGGGYSDIIDGSTTLIVAGGGGGSGSSGQWYLGGDGGGAYSSFYPDGQPGGLCATPSNCFATAYGGTQTVPGAGESETTVSPRVDGSPGSGSSGGAAGPATGGGGGGGGYFGGGGGATTLNGEAAGGGGGGGGSSYASSVLTGVIPPAPPGGNGVVTVTYTVPTPPAIASAAHASFTVGTAGTYTITGSGNPAATISLDNPTALPAGLKFIAGAAGTGTGTLSGTPTGNPGTVTITVRAHNGVGSDATQPLVIDVVKPPGTQSVGGGYVSLGGGSSGSGSGSPVTATSSGVGVIIGCAGASGKTCTGQVAVSLYERRHGKKVVAVFGRPKAHSVSAVVGKATYKIRAGQVKVVKVTLNASGRSLLKRFRRLTVKVTVSVSTTNGLHKAATRTVTIKAPRKAKHT